MTYKEKPVEHKVWILKPQFVKPCEQNKSKKVLVANIYSQIFLS